MQISKTQANTIHKQLSDYQKILEYLSKEDGEDYTSLDYEIEASKIALEHWH